tara:strand:- start:3477 stop:4379 length:903 start_codon:yes stop_codon:yes gene_type:complete
MKFKNNNFNKVDDISDFGITDPVTLKVKEFYEEYPFPNYKIDDNKYTLSQAGDRNTFSKKLKKFIGFNKSILEVGSGTSQLSNYLAIGTNNQVYAFDTSMKSLKIGNDFAKKSNIKNINFIRGDIFDKIFQEEAFDFVLCNGVLHHTKNPYEAFSSIAKCLKREGYILVGLYNKIGRFRTKFRKILYKIFGKRSVMLLDPVLRKIGIKSKDKIEAWVRDQYEHPVESTHTFDEVLKWFKDNNIEFIDSIPKCSVFNILEETLFEKSSKETYIERIFQQFFMILSKFGSEGGLFIFIGKKK